MIFETNFCEIFIKNDNFGANLLKNFVDEKLIILRGPSFAGWVFDPADGAEVLVLVAPVPLVRPV